MGRKQTVSVLLVAMSGLDNSVWNKIGHAKHTRRVKTREGFHQP